MNVPIARAATSLYLDVNGTASGVGIANGGSYGWDSNTWNTVSAGTGTPVAWIPGAFPRFTGGVSGNAYTVTVTNAELMSGLFNTVAGVTVTIAATGSGSLQVSNGLQGFLVSGPVVITAPITGVGGIQLNNQNSGDVSLFGTNTYSGGTSLLTASGNFNNASSFGTGPISCASTLAVLADTLATAPITITNGVITTNGEMIIVTAVAAPVTFSGPWTNFTGTTRITMGNTPFPASFATISGKMFGAAGNILKDGTGTLVINGTNANVITTTTTNGLLEIGTNGSITGTVVVSNTAGSLKLDSTTALSTAATLTLGPTISNNAVNLNFTGTDTIFALFIGGVSQPSGTYGAVGSSAANQSAQFTGTGTLTIPATPAVVQQPQSMGVLNGANANFAVNASGGAPLTYQWKFNGANIPGATNPNFSISPVATNNAGLYSVAVSNTVGFAISSNATLLVVESNLYTASLLSSSGGAPIGYWRFDETNGTTAYDCVSTNNGTYVNAVLNQPGFSLADTDTAFGVPASTNSRGYVSVTNFAPFNFTSFGNPFTIEAWAYFTNLNGVQRIVSTLGNGNGYAFGINGSTGLRFTQGAKQDADLTLSSPLTTGVWYQFAVICDGNSYTFMIDGAQVGSTIGIVGVGNGVFQPLTFGANPLAYTFASEQVNGRIDEISIYNNSLFQSDINAHWTAHFGPLSTPIVTVSVATPPTNYVSLSTTIQSQANGLDLSYQWFKSPSTMLSGQNNANLTLANLQLSDAGSYYVQVSNPAGTSNSPPVAITVLSIPTNAAQLNLTSNLVLHLPFDNSLSDTSGRNNNGTNVGATSFVSPGAVGANALHYSSDTNANSFNYVTLGVVGDLQFGATTNFSVSFWIRQSGGSTFTNLPFFTDAVGSTGHGGYAFAPYAATGGGGWMWTVGSVTSPNAFTTFSDVSLINDGNWHNLIHVADRSANLTTYLDGVQVDSQAINFIGSIDTTNATTIGQDPTGAYPVTASADIDDLGVWQRTLTPLEVSGIYLAGASNSVSFAPAVVSRATLSIANVGGSYKISWPGSGTLQATTNILGGYTNVTGGTSSPYTIPTPLGTQMYYRLHQ